MSPLLLLLLAILLCLHPMAVAGDVPRHFSCQPLRSTFCRNIHVGCAGATAIPTAPFEVSVLDSSAQVEFEGPEPSLRGRVSGSDDLVIRLENSRSWIRIQPDGRYSHRIYEKDGAAMSQGTCRRTSAQ